MEAAEEEGGEGDGRDEEEATHVRKMEMRRIGKEKVKRLKNVCVL